MSDRIRAKDWRETPLGEREGWSDTLVSLVNLILLSPFPSVLFWGQELVTIYKPTRVCGADLFDNVLSVFQGRIINSRVEVQRRDRKARPVECFEGEIRQVLVNLVGNAIDALHATGGRLLLHSQEGRNWQNGGRGIVLTVADSGGGMSPEVQRKLFEAFYTTRASEERGLDFGSAKRSSIGTTDG